MTMTITRRAALAGSVALPLAPAAAMASRPETPAPFERLLAEVRHREALKAAWWEAHPDAEDPPRELVDWSDAPFAEIIDTQPRTAREFAAKVEAALLVHGDLETAGDTCIGGAIERDAKTILGLPMPGDAPEPQEPSTAEPVDHGPTWGEVQTAKKVLARLGKPATDDAALAILAA